MRRRVASAPVGRLATTGEDGRPRLVPFCFALEGDVLYSAVDHKPKSTTELRRLDDVRARPQVAVLVDHYEDDWSRLWWVRLRGRARVVDDDAEAERARRLLAEKYEQYRSRPPEGPVLAVAVDEWRAWSP